VQICQLDFSFDWGIKEFGLTPRTKPLDLYTRERVIAEAGKIGGEAIEFRHEYWSDCEPRVMARLARDAGLQPASYVSVKNIALPQQERRPVIDEIYGLLDRTAELGARVAMIIFGLVDDRFTIEQQLMWMIEGIQTCAERAHSMGITLLMENLDWPPGRPFAGTGTVCRRVCEAVDSPAFRLIYDFKASLFSGQDYLEAFDQMAPYVVHVHVNNVRELKDGETAERFFDTNDGRRLTEAPLDKGIVDVPLLLRKLKSLDYIGYLTMEYQGHLDPVIGVSRQTEYIQNLLGELNE